MKTKVFSSLILAYFILTSVNAQEVATIKGKALERKIGTFHSINVGGLAVVYLADKAQEKAQIEISGMPEEDLLIHNTAGVLSITTKGNHSGEKINVYIGSSTLNSISVSGNAQLRSSAPIKSNQLVISVVDNASSVLEIETGKLTVNMDGGDLKLSGKAGEKKINLLQHSGKGNLDLSELKSVEGN
jgi:hypothetical protein